MELRIKHIILILMILCLFPLNIFASEGGGDYIDSEFTVPGSRAYFLEEGFQNNGNYKEEIRNGDVNPNELDNVNRENSLKPDEKGNVIFNSNKIKRQKVRKPSKYNNVYETPGGIENSSTDSEDVGKELNDNQNVQNDLSNIKIQDNNTSNIKNTEDIKEIPGESFNKINIIILVSILITIALTVIIISLVLSSRKKSFVEEYDDNLNDIPDEEQNYMDFDSYLNRK